MDLESSLRQLSEDQPVCDSFWGSTVVVGLTLGKYSCSLTDTEVQLDCD